MTMTAITLPAYAKINLYLAVTGRLPNGYHTVETVMQAISLHDLVTVEVCEDTYPAISLTCSVPDIPCDATNLVWRAAENFFQTAERQHPTFSRAPIRIHIEKHIPAAGGLAGGSTDAAAALIALNRLSDDCLDQDTLLSIAASLGADVPFCVLANLGYPTALGLHYGEQMTVLPTLPSLHVVVATNGEGCPTPWAYSRIDALPYDAQNGYHAAVAALTSGDSAALFSQMYNVFEAAIFPERPLAKTCHTILSQYADRAILSGSGSAVIGLFTDQTRAKEACTALIDSSASVSLCRTL